MREVEQLEQRVQKLSVEDFARFREWFLEFEERSWDRRIEADLKAGKLNCIISEALEEYKAGKAKEL